MVWRGITAHHQTELVIIKELWMPILLQQNPWTSCHTLLWRAWTQHNLPAGWWSSTYDSAICIHPILHGITLKWSNQSTFFNFLASFLILCSLSVKCGWFLQSLKEALITPPFIRVNLSQICNQFQTNVSFHSNEQNFQKSVYNSLYSFVNSLFILLWICDQYYFFTLQLTNQSCSFMYSWHIFIHTFEFEKSSHQTLVKVTVGSGSG